MTPTNHVWPASQDRVPSVWCCPTPHWLVNEGLCGGVGAGWWWWWGGRGVLGGRAHSAASIAACVGPAVDSQLLRHHNKQRPHRGRQAERSRQCGTLAGSAGPPIKPRRSISLLSLRKQSCLYWPWCEELLSAFFSLPLSIFVSPLSTPLLVLLHYLCVSLALPLLSPSFSTPPLLSSFLLLLSPASLEQMNSRLGLTRSKCTGCKTSRSSLGSAICLTAKSKEDSNFLYRLSLTLYSTFEAYMFGLKN